MKKVILTMVLTAVGTMAFSQTSDSVYFRNRDTIRFGATLSVPAGKKASTAIVLVSGTGKQDRNGTMAGHQMFKVLADSLNSIGVAVLRVDDRGTGETNGVYETSTTADFANDALAAATYLRTRGYKKVGLLGHSEGGAAATIAAAKGKIDFVITLAGLATKGLDALKTQNTALIETSPLPAYDKKRLLSVTLQMFDTAYYYATSKEMGDRLNNTYNTWKKASDSAFAKDFPNGHDHVRFPVYSYVMQATGPWYRFHIQYDPVPWLQQVKVPFLALNGDKDLMVSYKENLQMIRQFIPHAVVKVLPGINHLFQHCVTCTQQESYSLKEDFAPEAWQEIREFLVHL